MKKEKKKRQRPDLFPSLFFPVFLHFKWFSLFQCLPWLPFFSFALLLTRFLLSSPFPLPVAKLFDDPSCVECKKNNLGQQKSPNVFLPSCVFSATRLGKQTQQSNADPKPSAPWSSGPKRKSTVDGNRGQQFKYNFNRNEKLGAILLE